MFCPRCGAETEDGARYCASCGNELPRAGATDSGERGGGSGPKAFFVQLIGTSRRSRLVTLATVAALAAAVVAFVVLEPANDEGAGIPQDALTKSLDVSCVGHKRGIAAAERRALEAGGLSAVATYADSIVSIVGEWRMDLSRASVPASRATPVNALKATLLEVEIEAGTLARAARESDRRGVAAAAHRLDVATANVEAAIHALELERCGALLIAGGRAIQG